MKPETAAYAARRILGEMPERMTLIPHEEGGGFYSAWKVDCFGGTFFLKQSCPTELSIYERTARDSAGFPAYLGSAYFRGKPYLLLEYIEGHDMMRCTRGDLILVLDALIGIQRAYWQSSETVGDSFEKTFASCRNRRAFLQDARLLPAYDAFLAAYEQTPHTLCHNDLLPFNVRVDGRRAVLIDWEHGGILPYPLPLARLLAHTMEDPDALFFMTVEDRRFAILYYYDVLIKEAGISLDDYLHTLALFFLYEKTEWIYVYNRFKKRRDARFAAYQQSAHALAARLCAEQTSDALLSAMLA